VDTEVLHEAVVEATVVVTAVALAAVMAVSEEVVAVMEVLFL
jgi:hypothetical protein